MILKILLESFTIIKQDIPYIAGPKQGSMPFGGTLKLKFLKLCRIKLIKSILFYFFSSFILTFFFVFFNNNMTQGIATVKNENKKKRKKRKKKKEKIYFILFSFYLFSVITIQLKLLH